MEMNQNQIMELLDTLYAKSINGIPKVSQPIDVLANDYLSKNNSIEKAAKQFVKERIEGGANEKAVLRLFINCPFVCINFDFFWLNKVRQLYMDF